MSHPLSNTYSSSSSEWDILANKLKELFSTSPELVYSEDDCAPTFEEIEARVNEYDSKRESLISELSQYRAYQTLINNKSLGYAIEKSYKFKKPGIKDAKEKIKNILLSQEYNAKRSKKINKKLYLIYRLVWLDERIMAAVIPAFKNFFSDEKPDITHENERLIKKINEAIDACNALSEESKFDSNASNIKKLVKYLNKEKKKLNYFPPTRIYDRVSTKNKYHWFIADVTSSFIQRHRLNIKILYDIADNKSDVLLADNDYFKTIYQDQEIDYESRDYKFCKAEYAIAVVQLNQKDDNLRWFKLTDIDNFKKETEGLVFTETDMLLQKSWMKDDKFFLARKHKSELNSSDRLCDFLEELIGALDPTGNESANITKKDIKKYVEKKIMHNAISRERERREEYGNQLPNKENGYALLTII